MNFRTIFLTLSLSTVLFCSAIKIERPKGYVNDFANKLSSIQVAQLEKKLKDFNDTASVEISIYTENIDILSQNETAHSRGLSIFNTWKIGKKDLHNGILIYVNFKNRKFFINTGKGSEGFVPDIMAFRIIEKTLKPAFRKEQYYTGLDRATNILMDLSTGEYEVPKNEKKLSGLLKLFIILAIILIILMIFGKGGTNNGRGYTHRGPYVGGGYIGGGFPRGGFTGGGGGGFGGFGGGFSGGGGAGGGW